MGNVFSYEYPSLYLEFAETSSADMGLQLRSQLLSRRGEYATKPAQTATTATPVANLMVRLLLHYTSSLPFDILCFLSHSFLVLLPVTELCVEAKV
jgi:hypothetical protein